MPPRKYPDLLSVGNALKHASKLKRILLRRQIPGSVFRMEQSQIFACHRLQKWRSGSLKLCGILLALALLISFINIQYARAVSVHKLTTPLSLEIKHPVKQLLKTRFYRGDMVNSFQSSQFAVTILCPKELAMLIKQLTRGIHLCGLACALVKIITSLAILRRQRQRAIQGAIIGATIFGCAYCAPDSIRALAIWSLGFAPY